ncbi:MAG: hypothetical protein JXO72_05780 [Vicinamibacteria bacterium]|nr:hypothetical protein [Vicinamibacteria bacterium]
MRKDFDRRDVPPWLERPARRRTAPSGTTSVERIDPDDGSCGVFRDTIILIRLSYPIDPLSLSNESVRVETPDGTVPGRVALSPDGAVLLWRAHSLLEPRCIHVVLAEGLRDTRGEAVDRRTSRFMTSDLTLGDLAF